MENGDFIMFRGTPYKLIRIIDDFATVENQYTFNLETYSADLLAKESVVVPYYMIYESDELSAARGMLIAICASVAIWLIGLFIWLKVK